MKVIALEEHVVSPLYLSKMAASPRRSTSLDDRSAKLGHDIRAELADIGESRIKYMDATGIDVQVLSLTMPGIQAFAAADVPAVARDVNDRIHAAVTAHPTRACSISFRTSRSSSVTSAKASPSSSIVSTITPTTRSPAEAAARP